MLAQRMSYAEAVYYYDWYVRETILAGWHHYHETGKFAPDERGYDSGEVRSGLTSHAPHEAAATEYADLMVALGTLPAHERKAVERHFRDGKTRAAIAREWHCRRDKVAALVGGGTRGICQAMTRPEKASLRLVPQHRIMAP